MSLCADPAGRFCLLPSLQQCACTGITSPVRPPSDRWAPSLPPTLSPHTLWWVPEDVSGLDTWRQDRRVLRRVGFAAIPLCPLAGWRLPQSVPEAHIHANIQLNRLVKRPQPSGCKVVLALMFPVRLLTPLSSALMLTSSGVSSQWTVCPFFHWGCHPQLRDLQEFGTNARS